MFDNVLHQNTTAQICGDIMENRFPGAVLFSGPGGSGKLTSALETARVLSCAGERKGHWLCACPSCLLHKALSSASLLIAGPRDCTPEIAAAERAFVAAVSGGAKYLDASRYFFLRSVRKLTARFNPVLWQGDDKLSKIAAVVSEIDEELEPLDFPHELPEAEKIAKATEKLRKLCEKLEGEFLYDSIPIAHIRNASAWARLKVAHGKKTIIIENADRMLESVRNALLKILEEPPEDTVFILTTARRSAVMPTILSRVRTYNFYERPLSAQHEVIQRVFHADGFSGSIDDYLLTFLPVQPALIAEKSRDFFSSVVRGHIPDIPALIKDCGKFEPRVLLRLFLNGMQDCSRKLLASPVGSQAAVELTEALGSCWNTVTVYNQSVNSALEILVRELAKINKTHGMILRWAVI